MAESRAGKTSRLSRSAEFDRVYRRGKSAQHRLLVLYRFERPEDVRVDGDVGSRLGITVSKKLGGAVDRNRLRRQLRAALGACQRLEAGSDYVAIARPGLAEVAERSHEELVEIVDELAERLATQPASSK